MASGSPDILSQAEQAWLDEHLKAIEQKIKDAAREIAQANGRTNEITPMDVSEATRLYAPGDRVITSRREISWGGRILDSISGVTLISGLLAVAFGVIGFLATGSSPGSPSPGWIDIAKIFAGAVVGSTGAGVASAMGRR